MKHRRFGPKGRAVDFVCGRKEARLPGPKG